ncbi:sialate O-acetylesterase [Xylanibacter muris]|uniref:Polysaccharide deacetylase n=1 Tax=Xylanibacter muris TaxID=2736290 RepID=A0ABX2AP44_9BACT|nr:sialate O-acetylesterase [Xylanibacter muris]NPD92007.1 polysaccharide deacetylase [Xylanibacter muris]
MVNYRFFLLSILMCCLGVMARKPADVFIYAGQSNSDGRAFVSSLPDYLKGDCPYRYLRFANVTTSSDGKFGMRKFDNPKGRFAFCDVTNYWIEKALKRDFYAVKCTYGGTAIDTLATLPKRPVWCADSEWISRNNAHRGDITTGKSLTKSLTEGFADCVNVTLSRLDGGYDVKAIMWHQGESDRKKAGHYYKNFKDMILYMRNAIYAVTGDEADKTLPFIFGTVPHKSKQYSREVEEAQKRVAAELPNVYCIDLSYVGLLDDQLHFDGPWTEYVGKLMYNKLVELKLVKGKALKVRRPN